MKDLLYQGLIYSLDESLTIGRLSAGDYSHTIPTDALERWLSTHDVECVVHGMNNYHYKLSCVKSPPYVVYYGGDIGILDRPMLAVVGPRLRSTYADRVLDKLFGMLQQYDVVTISGVADGVDWYAHQLSIEAGIPTVGVLGAGIEHYLRSAYAERYHRIVASGGLILSQFPLKMKSTHYTYPQRNRIIAGLADAVFLPEAAQKSGSLITVDFALSMNKPIGATPNSIFDSSSAGVNAAMQSGRIQTVQDIELFLSQYFRKKTQQEQSDSMQFSSVQQSILSALGDADQGGVSLSFLMKKLALQSGELLSELSILEMMGMVREESDGRFVGVG